MLNRIQQLILALVFLNACGIDINHNVSGEATVVYKIDLDLLRATFEEYCKSSFPDSTQLQEECVSEEIVKFLHALEGMK